MTATTYELVGQMSRKQIWASPPLRARTRRRPRLTWLQALALVATVTTGAVLAGASLVTATDPDRFPDFPTAVWSSVTTVTTVGYGDVVPVSPGHANPSGRSALSISRPRGRLEQATTRCR
jgi:hypothetical protein